MREEARIYLKFKKTFIELIYVINFTQLKRKVLDSIPCQLRLAEAEWRNAPKRTVPAVTVAFRP